MENFIEMFNQYARSELLILVPVLYIIGKLLVESKVSNHKIPLIITLLSIAICGIYTFSTVPIFNATHVLLSLFTSVTQGVLFAGASVLGKILSHCKEIGEKNKSGESDNQNDN